MVRDDHGRRAGWDNVRFEVLGPFQVRDGERVVDIGRPQHRAVLAALLIDAGRVVPAEVLLGRVWGEQPGAGGTASLYACISRLRKRLGPIIVTQAPGYRLDVAGRDIDAVRFSELVSAARRAIAAGRPEDARAHVTEALALHRGTPYGGIRSDFAAHEVSRLEDQVLAATELAAELDLTLGREADLVTWLPDTVAAHPLREGMRGTLMTALYRLGRQAEALRLYDEAQRLLSDELGVDPGPALQRLHTLVLRQDPSLDAAPETPRPRATPRTAEAATPQPARDDMVGRDQELGRCRAALHRARDGAPAVVVVYGEAGIGKTRLVEEVTRDRGDVAWGRCFDHAGSPAFGPWAQVLATLAELRGSGLVTRALTGRGAEAALLLPPHAVPGARPAPVAGAPEVARARLYDAVTAFLEAMAAERPVTVVLEDLHWADPESAELTEYVAATARAGGLALLMTVRTPAEDGGAQGETLLAALARRPGTERVALHGLDTADVRRFAAGRLGTDVDGEAAERLRRRTDGNPFYIAELVRLLGEERQISGRALGTVPTTVRAVIERRLRHLDPATRELLATAAVLGRGFDLRVLGDVAGRTPAEVAAGLDPAATAGILVPDPESPGRWSFAHALVQDTLATVTGPMRRAALHAQVAETLERRHDGDLAAVAASLAHHHAAAGLMGDPARAVSFSLLAAEAAQERLAFGEGRRHLERALDLVSSVPGAAAAELELRARVQLGSLLTLLYGYNAEEVSVQRRRALRLATETGSTEHLLSALWGTWGIALVSGDFPAADAVADEMAAACANDPLMELAYHHARGQIRYHQGRLLEAKGHLERAAELADRHAKAVRLEIFLQHPAVAARSWLAKVLALMGDTAASDEAARMAEVRNRAVGDPYTATYIDILEGWRAVFLDRPEDALRHGEHGYAVAEEHGFAQLVAFSLVPRGWGRARHGRTAEGATDIERAIAIFSSQPTGHMFGPIMAYALADALRVAGRTEEALETTEAGIAEGERIGERFFLAGLYLQRAELTGDGAHDRERAAGIAREQSAGLFLRGRE
ncbi:putative SARP-family transcriptional regulator [Actinoplanes missouriensis 431]|uniref:Putative SARP-family transcriptional regulator n=1 Tax=Actinoplanes missouriensis (strain ATCC 14538 / DSM 43046 / CBS 188.64 / JCM 3121 / NBRC 102363 / NCIMB 12654 / NRRL B-3342 / UNCC 431) TaxID=512565 RepID=I0HFG1_ACTM4|nr:AfsR/SARP family transcriptional regulator [Actinoplanes missouriensis]BAL91748.1 putative SARP-family transcriptional regulator [Actinoplanes missouriensis 431]